MNFNVELIAITPNSEQVIEKAARICYQSQNKITQESAREFIPKLLVRGHESPIEHATASFLIKGCSRATSHQLVRHRFLSVSQKSQRYVSEENFEYIIPLEIQESVEKIQEYQKDMNLIRDMYKKWKSYGLRNEYARCVLPNACTTELMISTNFREFRHIFNVRCTKFSQDEIRLICLNMLDILYKEAPSVFQDLYEKFILKKSD